MIKIKINHAWVVGAVGNGFVVETDDGELRIMGFDANNTLTPYAGPHPSKIGGVEVDLSRCPSATYGGREINAMETRLALYTAYREGAREFRVRQDDVVILDWTNLGDPDSEWRYGEPFQFLLPGEDPDWYCLRECVPRMVGKVSAGCYAALCHDGVYVADPHTAIEFR